MATAKDVDFLRVLIAAAWADGDITYQEMNALRRHFRRLDLSSDELASLEPYLADPISADEARGIIRDFLSSSGRADRERLAAEVRNVLGADDEVGAGEEEFLALFSEVDSDVSGVEAFVGRVKRLWRGGPVPGGETEFRRSELVEEFFRNRVLYQVKRQILQRSGRSALDADTERDLRWVCALGALLGHVAAADGELSAAERQRIVQLLDRLGPLQRGDVDAIVDIVESQVLGDVGYFPFAREFNEVASREERERVLDLLMQVAAADGEFAHAELEEIRKISMVLNLSHQDFITAKARAVGGG